MINAGDFSEGAIVYIPINTASISTGESVTITNFLNTDVHIHKNDSLTQRNNAAGITVSIDFDGITGNHLIKIDTSDDTVAGFWVANADYFIRIEGTTIEAKSVNVWVGMFSIENRAASKDLANATDGLGALKTLIDTIDTVVDAIKAKTDNLPADPADDSDIDAQLATIAGYLDTEIATILAAVDTEIAAIKAKTDNLPSGIAKNVALSNFEFLMIDSTDHVSVKTGLTITAQISKDGGAFTSCTNSVAEIGSGLYKVNITQAEMNADIITLKFTSTGADQRTITITTS